MPCPTHVKWEVLRRYGGEDRVWIETGTYYGDTTAFLAEFASHVYTIEPSPTLAAGARQRFTSRTKVSVVEGTSESALELVLGRVSGNVSFWLDGHFSAGVTFKGAQDTPILAEKLADRGPYDSVRCCDGPRR